MGCIRTSANIKINPNLLKNSSEPFPEDDSERIEIKNFITKNDSKVQDNYIILSKLGKGAFGSVFKVKHLSTNQIRAMKVIKKTSVIPDEENNSFLKEIEMLMKLDHPNIIKIYEYYLDEINYYLIIEYVSGGELYEYITKNSGFSESKAKSIMKQILLAINYLHSNDIIHRDIKPDNILVDSSNSLRKINIKLIDFGTCCYIIKNTKLTLKVGSPYYMAPEVIKEKYNKECDIWSCGVVLYIMFVGHPPFYGDKKDEIFQKIKKGKFDTTSKEWENVPDLAKDLITKMLEKDIEKRLTASQCLQHKWLSGEEVISQNISKEVMHNVWKNILNFNAKEKLQQATIAYLIHSMNSTEEINLLKEVFQKIDENGDGKLTINELKNCFLKLTGERLNNLQIHEIINDVRKNDENAISYEEFLRLTIQKENLLNERNLQIAFDQFDLNKDKKLSKEEIKNVLCVSDFEYIDELLKHVDKNKDGFISFTEFKDLMKKILENEVIKIKVSENTKNLSEKRNKENTEENKTELTDDEFDNLTKKTSGFEKIRKRLSKDYNIRVPKEKHKSSKSFWKNNPNYGLFKDFSMNTTASKRMNFIERRRSTVSNIFLVGKG